MSFEVDVDLNRVVVDETERYIQGLRKGIVEADIGNEVTGKKITNTRLRYRIELEVSGRTGQARVKDEKFLALRRTDSREKSRGAFIEKVDKHRLSLRMEGQARPTNFDLGLDYTVISSDLYAPHYPHITAFKEEMRRCHFYYFEPRKLMRAGNAIADVLNIGSQGEELAAFYYNCKREILAILRNLKKNAASILPRLTDITLDKRPSGEIYIESHEKRPDILIR